MNIILTVIELVLISTLTVTLALFYREYRKIKGIVVSFFEHKEGEQSAFGVAIQNTAKMVGDAVAIQVKTTLMGKSSALSREEKAIENAVLVDQNPGIMAILESMPSLRKIVTKNPALLGLASNMLSKLNSGNHQPVSNQPKFKL